MDENFNEAITSGENLSVWFAAVNQPISYETLNRDIDTDILIIGGGISRPYHGLLPGKRRA